MYTDCIPVVYLYLLYTYGIPMVPYCIPSVYLYLLYTCCIPVVRIPVVYRFVRIHIVYLPYTYCIPIVYLYSWNSKPILHRLGVYSLLYPTGKYLRVWVTRLLSLTERSLFTLRVSNYVYEYWVLNNTLLSVTLRVSTYVYEWQDYWVL
jgi:hypothetical protein